MNMKLAKISLALSAFGFAAFGIVLFAAPQLLNLAGVEMTSASGQVEIRSFYGGIEIGLALFFIFSLYRRGWIYPALVAQISVCSGIVLARILSILFVSGQVNLIIYLSGLAEAFLAIIGVLALMKMNEPKKAGKNEENT
jgi:hypothetical protein